MPFENPAARIEIRGAGDRQPDDRLQSELNRLLEKWQPVLHLFTRELIARPFSLSKLLRKGWRHLYKLHGTVASELERTISDPAVRAAMAGMLLYTGLPPEKTPVLQIMGLVALFEEGFFLPEGGMGAIPEALERAMLEQGGEIVTGAAVNRIRVANGRVTGLEVQGRGRVEVDAVVSSISGMHTFGSLIDAAHVPAAMRRKVEQAPLSQKALSIQLGLSNRLDTGGSYSITLLPYMEEQYRFFAPATGLPEWFSYSVPTVTMPELAPAGGSIIEMFAPIDQSWPVERWDEETRVAAAESAIAAFSRLHKLDVAVQRIQSPKEYRDNMHLYAGAVYGLSPAAESRAQFPHKTPIKGLFQAGQTTYPGYGIGPAALSGIFAAEALIASIRG